MEANKPPGFDNFDNLMRKLVKMPAGAVPAEPKRFCASCSHDRWQHGEDGCRKQGCDCRLTYEQT